MPVVGRPLLAALAVGAIVVPGLVVGGLLVDLPVAADGAIAVLMLVLAVICAAALKRTS